MQLIAAEVSVLFGNMYEISEQEWLRPVPEFPMYPFPNEPFGKKMAWFITQWDKQNEATQRRIIEKYQAEIDAYPRCSLCECRPTMTKKRWRYAEEHLCDQCTRMTHPMFGDPSYRASIEQTKGCNHARQ